MLQAGSMSGDTSATRSIVTSFSSVQRKLCPQIQSILTNNIHSTSLTSRVTPMDKTKHIDTWDRDQGLCK